MIRDVLKYGDERLLRPSAEVKEFDTPDLLALVSDLWETMEHENGVGIAAPQVGVRVRIVVFGFEVNQRYPDAAAVPKTVLINPFIRAIGLAREDGQEGCLSVPGWRGLVGRWSRIEFAGRNEHGEEVRGTAQGFHARVIQHECDHLDGILYPMRMANRSRIGAIPSISEL